MSFNVRFLILVLLLIAFTALSGCVRRRLTLRTDPPGAVAYLDNAKLGKTPISRNFDFYGKREIRFVKEGYETHTELVHLRAPWYQWIGFDFVSEVLVPGTITDERFYYQRLKPQKVVSPDDLIAEGERLKAIAHSSGSYRVSGRTPTSGFGSGQYGDYDQGSDYRYNSGRDRNSMHEEALTIPTHDSSLLHATDPDLYPSLYPSGQQNLQPAPFAPSPSQPPQPSDSPFFPETQRPDTQPDTTRPTTAPAPPFMSPGSHDNHSYNNNLFY